MNNQAAKQNTGNKGQTVLSPLEKLKGKTADQLIKRYELDASIPVNLDRLLEDHSVSLYATDFTSLENRPDISKEVDKKGLILGAVDANQKSINIFYRNTDTIHRQKFTIAHELAHCCLNADRLAQDGHIEYRTDIDSQDPKSPEYRANIFAGELLIPENVLNSIYEVNKEPSIDTLAKVFDVSRNVMKGRLEHLRLPYRDNLRVDFT